MAESLPNERDLELAELLNDSSAGFPEGADPMVDVLADYRAQYQSQGAQGFDTRTGARLWASIDRATRPGADRPAVRRLPSTMRLVWSGLAVAAAVTLLVIVPGLFRESGPVAAAVAEQMIYTTDDGSTITLRPNSRLYQDGPDATYRLEGEAFFDVTHNPARVFRVVTGDGSVEVLGTRFNVAAWPRASDVFLEQGRVRLIAGADSVILEPGQRVSSVDGTLGPPQVSDGREATDWMRGEILFSSRTASDVARELGRHFSVDLEIPGNRSTEALSGRILLMNREQALQDFGLVLGGRFVPAGNGLRFIAD